MVRIEVDSRREIMSVKKSMQRRVFLKVSTLGAVGAGIPAHKVSTRTTGSRTQTTTDELKIKEYRKLGQP